MDELKAQALLQEVEEQRNWALTRCAQMRAELVAALKKIEELTPKPE
jgi:hypothetical protein